jgi:hypothetical protein
MLCFFVVGQSCGTTPGEDGLLYIGLAANSKGSKVAAISTHRHETIHRERASLSC